MAAKTDSKWRRWSRAAIAKCMEEQKPTTAAEFRKAVSDYYPFHVRDYHPYKMWLDEVRLQAERIERKETPDAVRLHWFPERREG